MGDPREGLAPDGTIRTGAADHRIPADFRPVLVAAVSHLVDQEPDVSVYVYGSVANGTARSPDSDVDLLTVGLAADAAAQIAGTLSARFADRSRGVEIAIAVPSGFDGDGDEAYGGRVFLHHYCVHLAGPDLDRAETGFRGDRRAARGFNGDIDRHARSWRQRLAISDPSALGRQVARKTLLAVTGLVSIHDTTWTTNREFAAQRWQEVHPELGPGLDELSAWATGAAVADREALEHQLGTVIAPIVEQYATCTGLWPDPSD